MQCGANVNDAENMCRNECASQGSAQPQCGSHGTQRRTEFALDTEDDGYGDRGMTGSDPAVAALGSPSSPRSSRMSPRSPRRGGSSRKVTKAEWEIARELHVREAKLAPLPDTEDSGACGSVKEWDKFRTPRQCILTEAEREIQTKAIQDLITQKSAFKFRNVRDAFRLVDVDKSGTVTRREMHIFFRQFNLPGHQADLLFDALDRDDSGELDYVEFMDYFGSYIQPGTGTFRSAYKIPLEGSTIHDNNAVGCSLRKLG